MFRIRQAEILKVLNLAKQAPLLRKWPSSISILEKILEKLFDLKKIPTKLIFVIWLCTGIILFVPAHFLLRLNLSEFLKDYGKYIGISFVVCTGFLLIALPNSLIAFISRKSQIKKRRKAIVQNLHALDYHEKALLREFFINVKSALDLPFNNETVVGLVNKHIIYQASNIGLVYVHGSYFPYSITKVAYENLNQNSVLIDLPQNPTDNDINWLRDNRPTWAIEKSRIEDRRNSSWF